MNKIPTIGAYLDDEEKELIEAIESSERVPDQSFLTPERLKELQAAARATLQDLEKEREKISIRLSKSDLARIKARALREGMPYQTLIGSILHKAVS